MTRAVALNPLRHLARLLHALPGGAQPFVQALRQLLHLGPRAAGDIHRASLGDFLGYVGIYFLGYV